MLTNRNLIAAIGMLGFMTTAPDEQPVDTRPIAYLYEIECGQRRPEAVVFSAPNGELVHIFLTGNNNLSTGDARFLVNVDDDLRAKLTAPGVKAPHPDSARVNFQDGDLIQRQHLGGTVEPVFGEWLNTIAEAWSRPPRGTKPSEPAVA